MAEDPVLVQRERYRRVASLLQRAGGGLYLVAMAVFVVGMATDLGTGLVTVVSVCLVAGTVLLAPGMVLAYMVKAAVRDDRDKGLG